MRAFLFPGQASQYIGMAKDLYAKFDIARKYFDMADDVLGLDLRATCFGGPEEKLVRTEYTQPAIFVHSCIVTAILSDEGVLPSMAAGHSLGEYSALVAAGVLSFEEGLGAVGLRSRLMQQCCDANPGTMAAIIGMSLEQVTEVIGDIDGVVPANFNSPDQVAISGAREAVETACGRLRARGARRTILLAVGGAYHSPLMQMAKEEMCQYIETLKFGRFAFPILANVTGEPVNVPNRMKQLLCEQITSPVLWYPSIEKMYQLGVRQFFEVGPGKVLQGLLKRSLGDRAYSAVGLDKAEDLAALVKEKV